MYDPGGGPPNLVPQQPDNLNFGLDDEANHPLWYTIKSTDGEDTLANMPFREKMLAVKKLLPDVSECKYIHKEKMILLKSLKKHRERFSKINQLGNLKVKVEEKQIST